MAQFKNSNTGYVITTPEDSATFDELVESDVWERVDLPVTSDPVPDNANPDADISPESEFHKVLRPAKSANRNEWVAFLKDRGFEFNPDATKQELIELAPTD